MMHENIRISKFSYGVIDIVLSLIALCIFFFVPVAAITLNGKVIDSQTIMDLVDSGKDKNIFIIIPLIAVMSIIGVLKTVFQKLFHHFVVSVIHLYVSFIGALTFMVSSLYISEIVKDANTFNTIFKFEYSMGLCFPFLTLVFILWTIYSLIQYCSFYKWYPLQTLFWALHPIICPLATYILLFIVFLIFPNSKEHYLILDSILGLLVFACEMILLFKYHKVWNFKLRANLKQQQNLPNETKENTIQEELPTEKIQPNETYQEIKVVPQPLEEQQEKPIKEQHKKHNTLIYSIVGVSVIAVCAILYFVLGGKEHKEEKIDIPAIHAKIFEGKIGNSEIQMTLYQNRDSVYGSYFYKKIKNPIELRGKEEGSDIILNEFVDGKQTGKFNVFYGDYDGQYFLEGKWTNDNKQYNVYLDQMVEKILPSTDDTHPFVGEWETPASSDRMAFIRLGLYNKDINFYDQKKYSEIRIYSDKGYYDIGIDSILKLETNDAVLLAEYGQNGEKQEFKLHYSPSDHSLLLETELWGTYHLMRNDKDIETLLDEYKKAIESIPEEVPVLENPEIFEDETYGTYDYQEEETEYTPPVEETATTEDIPVNIENKEEVVVEDTDKIYDTVEEMPEFPGGIYAMMSYLSKNIKYPKEAQKNGIQGKVLVRFTVDTDGILKDIHIAKSVDPLLDKEALRVFQTMPKWKPGKQKGKAVKVRYTAPVNFKLQ